MLYNQFLENEIVSNLNTIKSLQLRKEKALFSSQISDKMCDEICDSVNRMLEFLYDDCRALRKLMPMTISDDVWNEYSRLIPSHEFAG